MYEVPKDKLPKNVKFKLVCGEKPQENPNQSNYKCTVLKVLPVMEWGLHKG